MVIGNISKTIESGLMYMDRDPAVREVIQKFLDNPRIHNLSLYHTPHYQETKETFGNNYDAMKYVAWQLDPEQYNKNLANIDHNNAEKDAERIKAFMKQVITSNVSITRMKEYVRINQILSWSTKQVGEMAKFFHPDMHKHEMKRKTRKLAAYDRILPAQIVPDYALPYMLDEIGSSD
ncbi:MAG: hypothetical protein GOV02_03580 [Candidatus Aenigmarchaeota archaeon]|nr:hypothetical protein [Candidatus Aenigmarchaeota archaeon]